MQARQRKKLWLQGHPVYPLLTHYCQTWQHLPDYGAYHATLIADPALLNKWQPGEEVIYLFVFEGDLTEGVTPEEHACQMLSSRLPEALPIPVLRQWAEKIWEAGLEKGLIIELAAGGDSLVCFSVQLAQPVWAELISRSLKEEKIKISINQ